MNQPIHVQVADDLRRRIQRGKLAPGTSMPSEARLCAEFDASRGTIRTALATLRREGLIAGGQGRPPTVRDTALGQPFETLISFSSWARETGHVPGQETIEVARRRPSPVAAEALGLSDDDHVIDVLRLRLLDDEPAMLERGSFVESVGQLLFDFDPDSGSIYAYLISQGVDLHAARHTMDAVAADDTDADLLAVEAGSPLLRERRRATDSHGTPLEYADDRYRPDRVTFTIDNTRPASAGISTDIRILKETS